MPAKFSGAFLLHAMAWAFHWSGYSTCSIFVADHFGLVALIASGYRALAWTLLLVYVLPLVTVGAWWLWRHPASPTVPSGEPT